MDRLPAGQNIKSPSIPPLKNIPLYRNSDLSYVSRVPAHQRGGRTSSRTRAGIAVDASGVVADVCGRAGQWIEPSPVSHCKPCERTVFDPVEPHGDTGHVRRSLWAKPEARVRRNRVVLAVVATVKPLRRRHLRQPARWREFRDRDGGKRNSSPGRARISRQTIAQGRPSFGCPVLPLCIACASFSHGGFMGASRRPVFPAPFPKRGCEPQSMARAKQAARPRAHAHNVPANSIERRRCLAAQRRKLTPSEAQPYAS
jgi:hypothetical protein